MIQGRSGLPLHSRLGCAELTLPAQAVNSKDGSN
jgi:hypothetical protein